MNNDTLYKNHLREGTAGYAVIRKFYFRYADVLSNLSIADVNDVVHEVFVSLSKTDFKSVQKVEHYIHRAIKLCCWSLLDKAVRSKTVLVKTRESDDATESKNAHNSLPGASDDHLTELDGLELLGQVNLFKVYLGAKEIQLLNFLIDDTSRSEMAHQTGINLNTLDTKIRRLRIRLADFLKRRGYTYTALERFTQ